MNVQTKSLREKDSLSLEYITAELKAAEVSLEVEIKECVDSTNKLLRTYGDGGKTQDTLLLAEHQTGGRGRKGRSFYSPEGTGLYMSLLLHPRVPAGEVHMLTTLAAAATAKALERFVDDAVYIKWVNDILVRNRKTVGILTETSGRLTEGVFDYVIVGIGINVYEPEGGFPEEIRESAGALFMQGKVGEENLRSKIAVEVVREFMELYKRFPKKQYLEEYRSRSCLIGKEIRVIPTEQITGSVEQAEENMVKAPVYARVLGIEEDCSLKVMYEDGSCELLSSGEVSVRER